jgi:hypothetical protein
MAKERRSLKHDPREIPTSVGPMHDTKGGTKPLPPDGPQRPPHAVPNRSKKARVK